MVGRKGGGGLVPVRVCPGTRRLPACLRQAHPRANTALLLWKGPAVGEERAGAVRGSPSLRFFFFSRPNPRCRRSCGWTKVGGRPFPRLVWVRDPSHTIALAGPSLPPLAGAVGPLCGAGGP
jgi:hypothetical protein